MMEDADVSVEQPEAGGYVYAGGKGYSPRQESGMTLIKEMRAAKRAVNAKRPDGSRWQTEMTPRELSEHNRTVGDLTFKQQALAATSPALNLMFKLDDVAVKRANGTVNEEATLALKATIMRSGLLASRIVAMMESQNQADDLMDRRIAADQDLNTLSPAIAEAMINQIVASVRDRLGDEEAQRMGDELKRTINLDTGTQGTTITPDMEAAAMDASVCGG